MAYEPPPRRPEPPKQYRDIINRQTLAALDVPEYEWERHDNDASIAELILKLKEST